MSPVIEVDGYRVPVDRYYHRTDHTWVRVEEDGLCRVGMDVLEQEISGDLAQLALVPPGTELEGGVEMGSLEAQKFVGALRAPICGRVEAVNVRLLEDPRLVNTDPFGDGWMLLIRPSNHLHEELVEMVSGDAIGPWFAERVRECRLKGVLAE